MSHNDDSSEPCAYTEEHTPLNKQMPPYRSTFYVIREIQRSKETSIHLFIETLRSEWVRTYHTLTPQYHLFMKALRWALDRFANEGIYSISDKQFPNVDECLALFFIDKGIHLSDFKLSHLCQFVIQYRSYYYANTDSVNLSSVYTLEFPENLPLIANEFYKYSMKQYNEHTLAYGEISYMRKEEVRKMLVYYCMSLNQYLLTNNYTFYSLSR